jgi:hypothetical protein
MTPNQPPQQTAAASLVFSDFKLTPAATAAEL